MFKKYKRVYFKCKKCGTYQFIRRERCRYQNCANKEFEIIEEY